MFMLVLNRFVARAFQNHMDEDGCAMVATNGDATFDV